MPLYLDTGGDSQFSSEPSAGAKISTSSGKHDVLSLPTVALVSPSGQADNAPSRLISAKNSI